MLGERGDRDNAHDKLSRKVISVELRCVFGLVFPDSATARKFASKPRFEVAFRPQESTDKNQSLQIAPVLGNRFLLNEEAASVVVRGKRMKVEVSSVLKIECDARCSDDEFDEWAYDQSGANCFEVCPVPNEKGWDFDEEFEGGRVYLGTRDAYGNSLNDD